MYTRVHKTTKMSRSKLEKIGVREFRNKIAQYIMGQNPIEVMRHGETVGYYFPVRSSHKQQEIEALGKVAEKLQVLLAEKGLTEEDIIKDFRQMKLDEKSKTK